MDTTISPGKNVVLMKSLWSVKQYIYNAMGGNEQKLELLDYRGPGFIQSSFLGWKTPLITSIVLRHVRISTEMRSTKITDRCCFVQSRTMRHLSKCYWTSIGNLVTFSSILMLGVFNLPCLYVATRASSMHYSRPGTELRGSLHR